MELWGVLLTVLVKWLMQIICGYVGTGPGKITLYKEKTVVKKNVPESEAVDALIDLIKENGDWVDKSN